LSGQPKCQEHERGGVRGYDSDKQLKGRKRHLLVDSLGLLLAVVVTAASVSDRQGARRLFARLGGHCKKLRRIWVDRTYRGKLLEWASDYCSFLLEPVLRSDEMKGFVLLTQHSYGGSGFGLEVGDDGIYAASVLWWRILSQGGGPL